MSQIQYPQQTPREPYTSPPKNRRGHHSGRFLVGVIIVAFALLIATIGVILLRGEPRQHEQISSEESAVTSVVTPQEQIDSLEQQVSRLQEQVSSQQEKIDSYDNEVADLNRQLTAKRIADQSSYTTTVADGTKVCYLTFDDGPSTNTPKILDILKENKVKATFFVIGDSRREYMKRIYDEGHTIGLHAYHHTYSEIYASPENYLNDLTQIQKLVQDECGYTSWILRFPGGTNNTVSKKYNQGIMTAVSQKVREMGYHYCDWNCDSHDADKATNSVENILAGVRSGGTSNKRIVVLMHDAPTKTTTPEALPQIIQFYRDNGYVFAPLTADTDMVTFSPAN